MKKSEIMSEARMWGSALRITAIMLCIFLLVAIYGYAGVLLYNFLTGQ